MNLLTISCDLSQLNKIKFIPRSFFPLFSQDSKDLLDIALTQEWLGGISEGK